MARIAITNGSTGGGTRRAATSYGRRLQADGIPTTYVDDEAQVLEIPFTYANLPTYGLDKIIQALPAGSHVDSMELVILTAFAGGTSLAVGCHKADGTAIDADGLLDATAGALANLTPAGAVLHGAGALVGTTLAYESQVTVTKVGTFTAGEGLIRVKVTPKVDRLNNFNG